MPRPLNDSVYLYGLHDRGGEATMQGLKTPTSGWVLATEGIGSERNNLSGADYSDLAGRGLGVIVRLNAGYAGVGTLPYATRYADFAVRCANFVQASRGAHIWVVGNEPNHPIEWPGAQWNWDVSPPRPVTEATRGEPILPNRYVDCYRQVRNAIRALPGHNGDQVLVAGPAPWNNLLRYPGNETGDWVVYLRDVLTGLVGPDRVECDGIALHTYTHGAQPTLITSAEKLTAAGFTGHHWHFRAYQDFMAVIPEVMQELPVYITETDQGDIPWQNDKTGWVQAAYSEIDRWNKIQAQKIRCLILYRWPQVPGDRWGIAGKEGVVEDFKHAITHDYRWDFDGPPPPDGLLARVEELERQTKSLLPAIQDTQALDGEVTRLKRTVDALAAAVRQLAVTDLANALAELEAEVQRLKAEIPRPPEPEAPQPPMSDLRGQLPTISGQSYPERVETAIRRVIVHHTVTRADITPQRLAQVQVNGGRPGITYHFLISGDGAIYWTQPFDSAVAQTFVPAANADGVAVALAGNFTDAPPPPIQLDTAAALIAWLVSRFKLSIADVYGRCELENVASPGKQWLAGANFRATLLEAVRDLLEASDPLRLIEKLRRQVLGLQAQVADLTDQVQTRDATIANQRAEIADLLRKLQECQSGQVIVTKPEIVDLVDSLEKHPTQTYPNRTKPITRLVIHHAASSNQTTVQTIAHYHVHTNGWAGIGYHYVVAQDGAIYQSQRDETKSNHAGGEPNNFSLGICLIGRFTKTNQDGLPREPQDQVPTPAQMTSVSHLAAWLMQKYKIVIEEVMGHRDVWPKGTVCPGDQWLVDATWKNTLRQRVKDRLAGHTGEGGPRMDHYLLLWDHGGEEWARADWPNVQKYIAHFRPTVGFAAGDALAARHVTIVGGDAGVTGVDEARLRAAGIDVHRMAGANEAETRAMLDNLVARNTLWPGAAPWQPRSAPVASAPPPAEPAAAPFVDPWDMPADGPVAILPTRGVAPDAPSAATRIKVRPYFDPVVSDK